MPKMRGALGHCRVTRSRLHPYIRKLRPRFSCNQLIVAGSTGKKLSRQTQSVITKKKVKKKVERRHKSPVREHSYSHESNSIAETTAANNTDKERTPSSNEEFCDSCGRSLEDPSLVYFQGHPQYAIEEFQVAEEGKLDFGVGADDLPLCNATGFSIFDVEGHMCPLDGNLIESGVELFMSGYLKSVENMSAEMEEEQVPVKQFGPITEWWTQSDNHFKNTEIRITTDLGEYNLLKPSLDYKTFMNDMYEKICIRKLVVDYLVNNGHLEPSYCDLVKAITKEKIQETNDRMVTEEILLKHSKYLWEEVSSFEDECDELSLTTLPCMRTLRKMCQNQCAALNVRTMNGFKKQKQTTDDFTLDKKLPSKATTTPLVRKTFETLFPNQMDVANNEIMPKKQCGVCEGCQRPDCGGCSNCKKMPKFGGVDDSRQVCQLRFCLLDQAEALNDDDKLADNNYEEVFCFSENRSKRVNWPYSPVTVEKDKDITYFNKVVVDDTEYGNGDYVMIKTMAENVPSLVGRIKYIYRENVASKSGYFHGELLMRSSDTVLGDVGHPREFFLSDHCCDGIPLSSIIKKVTVVKKTISNDWFTVGGESVAEECKKDDGALYYYQKYYDRFTARFMDIPNDPICQDEERKHRFCPSCERKTEMEFNEIPTVKGKICENMVDVNEVKKTEWSVVRWRSYDYQKGSCVFLRPDTVKLPNSYAKKQERSENQCKNDDLFPEYYRKKKNSSNFNITARRAFGIGIIISITSEGWGHMIDPHSIILKIRVLYRPENTNSRAPHFEDLNVVFWSEHVEEISFMGVVGPCELYYEKNIPVKTSRRQWLEEDPNRFYFKKAYNHLKEKIYNVPKEALLFGRKNVVKKTEIKPLRTLDVFAGCGGLSAGLHEVGVADCRWAIENEENAAQSFKNNNENCSVVIKDCNIVLKDILEGKKNESLPNKGDVELLCGGPPCQGFSGMNRYSSREHSEFKNSLVVTFLSYCDYYRPKYFILENVRNFVAFKKGMLVKLSLRVLLDMGYQCTFAVLQAGSYGIPQTRMRLIILASAPGYKLPLYPEPINTFNRIGCRVSTRIDGKLFKSNINTFRSAPRRTITIFDALSDLPEIENGAEEQDLDYLTEPRTHFQKLVRDNDENTLLTDHICKKMSALALERIKLIPCVPGADWRDLPNKALTLPDGTLIQKLKYSHHDRKQGKSKNGSLRGVCSCASGLPCEKKEKDKSDSTLIPWGMAHTANRNNNWTGIYGRLSWFNYFRTTITDPEPSGKQGRVLHPEQHRVVSVRECARSQGFKDSYRLSGSIADKYRQIGNAVPPPMAAAIGTEIKKALAATIK